MICLGRPNQRVLEPLTLQATKEAKSDCQGLPSRVVPRHPRRCQAALDVPRKSGDDPTGRAPFSEAGEFDNVRREARDAGCPLRDSADRDGIRRRGTDFPVSCSTFRRLCDSELWRSFLSDDKWLREGLTSSLRSEVEAFLGRGLLEGLPCL